MEPVTMWTTFATSVAGAAAGLTGLTFIVVAFRFDVLAVSAEYRNRVAQAVTLLISVTVTGALITIPQASTALGLELMVVGLLVAMLLRALDKAARRKVDHDLNPSL